MRLNLDFMTGLYHGSSFLRVTWDCAKLVGNYLGRTEEGLPKKETPYLIDYGNGINRVHRCMWERQ